MSKPKPTPAPTAPTGPVEPPEVYADKYLLAIEADTKLRPLTEGLRAETARLLQEREHLNAAWAALAQTISDRKAEGARLDTELGEQASFHFAQLRMLKQQVRDLLTGNAATQAQARAAALGGSRLAMQGYAASERELKADRRDLAVVLKELETGHEELVRVLRAENDKAAAALRLQFEAQARELAAVYEDKMARCREDMSSEREAELADIERRKAAHVDAMLASHEQAFTDIKAYFNEITHSNLDLIKSLKEEVDDLKKKELGDEKVMAATAEANKRMSDPMRKAIADVKRLREEREAYKLDVVALQECKAAAMVVSDRIEALRWEHEIMGQRYERLVSERDALARKFREAVHEVQQKAGFKTLLLEQKLAVVAEEKERAQMVLGEVLAHANLDPARSSSGGGGAAAGAALQRGAEGLAQRDAQLEALRQELEQASSAYDSCIAAFREKMRSHCIPEAEIGFPLASARDILLGHKK